MRISAARKTISARRGAGTSRHLAKARLAASTAASTSALADFWKMPTTSRVSAGLRSSKVSPVEDSTHSPSMKFLRILVGAWLRVAGEARVSVAIIAPYKCQDIDATAGSGDAARDRLLAYSQVKSDGQKYLSMCKNPRPRVMRSTDCVAN